MHTYIYNYVNSSTHSSVCSGCGDTITKSHSFACDGEENSLHYEKCADCGYRVNQLTKYQYSNMGTTHAKTCTDCGTSITENHNYEGKIIDELQHSLECDCGATNGTQGHIWTSCGIGKVKCILCEFKRILAPGENIPIIKNKTELEEETE